jgi:hypothetical protein
MVSALGELPGVEAQIEDPLHITKFEVQQHLTHSAKQRSTWGDNRHSAKGPGGQHQGDPGGFSVGFSGS